MIDALATYLSEVEARLKAKDVRIVERWDRAQGINSMSLPDYEDAITTLLAMVRVAVKALNHIGHSKYTGIAVADAKVTVAQDAFDKITALSKGE